MCQFLKLVGQAQCVALMPDLKRGDLSLGLQLLVQGLGAFESLFGYSKDARIVLAHRALGDGIRITSAPPASPAPSVSQPARCPMISVTMIR